MSRMVDLAPGTVRGWRGVLLSSALLLAPACGDDFSSRTSSGGADAGGAGATGGAGGGAAACEPGASEPCYGGAEDTEGVGACKAGTRTCSLFGVFGACEGAVEPAPETCATPEDDDCDGETNEEGEGCDCVPGASEPCYGGAEGTEGVGPCIGGTHTCGSDGKWGTCDGEVVPGVEDCDAGLVDEDCDGVVNEDGAACVCMLGSSQDCYSGDVATKDVGNCKHGSQVCNASGAAWEACLGEVLPATEDCYVKGDEDCNGNPCSDAIFNVGFGNVVAITDIKDVAFDSAGNVIAVGAFNGTLTVGNKSYVSNGDSALIVKLDKTGTVLWSAIADGNGIDSFNAVAVGPADSIFVAGSYQGQVVVGVGLIGLVNTASQGGIVVKYDSAGTYKAFNTWAQPAGATTFNDIAVSPAGEVTVVGEMTGKYPWPGYNMTYLAQAAVALVYDEALTYKTSFIWDAAGDQRITSVAYGPDGLYVAGVFDTSINLGILKTTSSNDDAFVMKLGAGGWVNSLKTTASNVSIAADAVGNVGVGVTFATSITPDVVPVASKGQSDVLLAVYDKAGALKFAKTYGDAASQGVSNVAFDSTSKLLATGYFSGTIDFGGKALSSGGGFFTKLDWGADKLAWSKAPAAINFFSPRGVAAAKDGRVAIGGQFIGALKLGLDPVYSQSVDGVVAVFNP